MTSSGKLRKEATSGSSAFLVLCALRYLKGIVKHSSYRMLSLFSAACASAVLSAAAAADEEPCLASPHATVVLFTGANCSRCAAFAPTWSALTAGLAKLGFATVDVV